MTRICFVMTPFASKYTHLLEDVIKPSITQANLVPVLGSSYEPGSIPEQIKRDIQRAAVAIAVLTDGNWNVAYEMGLAHMSGIPVIALIEAAPEEMPAKLAFDIRHHRVMPYRPTQNGYRQLRESLVLALPKLEDEQLITEMIAPVSLSCEKSVIAAAPLAYRDALRKVGGWTQFHETFSDHVGVRSLLRNFAVIRGFEGLPELWNPNDFQDRVLTGDESSAASPISVYSIGSPKSNRFTGLLMEKFFEQRRPRFAFVADKGSKDLRNVRVSLERDGHLYLEGIDPDRDDRRRKDIGLIIRGPNPYYPDGMMLILAGRSSLGTEAACRAALEPRGIRMIFDHLQINLTSRRVAKVPTSEFAESFWACATMTADTKTGKSEPSSLVVHAAQYFG